MELSKKIIPGATLICGGTKVKEVLKEVWKQKGFESIRGLKQRDENERRKEHIFERGNEAATFLCGRCKCHVYAPHLVR